MPKIRVLVVDDHVLIRLALRDVIANDADTVLVGEATNGEEALSAVEHARPDVILLDLMMPVMDGLTTLKQLRARHPEMRVLILTGVNEESTAVAAARAGACGYLNKTCAPEGLLPAIHRVAAGEEYWPPPASNWLARSLRRQPAAALDPLTPREEEVLVLLGRGLSNQAIAKRLMISQSTARVHVHHILQKLGLNNRTQAALYARERGNNVPLVQ
jgi:NarL family two-component system response regulator LiaR